MSTNTSTIHFSSPSLLSLELSYGRSRPGVHSTLEHRPKLKLTEVLDEIPVIDLANIFNPSNDNTEQIVSEIGSACQTWGFFEVVNHGVPPEMRRKLEAVTKQFFDGSLEEKKKVSRGEANAMGFYESELTKNVRDWKEVFDCFVQDPTYVPASPEPDDKELRTLTNQWPLDPADFRKHARSMHEKWKNWPTSCWNLFP